MALSRSEQMSRIRGKNTSPEVLLRKALWARGIRYRLDYRTPAGRADFAIPGKKVAVFVDGCFWHGCPDHYVRPRTRTEFWAGKLQANVLRDRRQTLTLERDGWRVVRVWEHQVFENLEEVVDIVLAAIAGRYRRRRRWCVVQVLPLDASGNLEQRVMEDLRDCEITCVREQQRSTKKWHLPKPSD